MTAPPDRSEATARFERVDPEGAEATRCLARYYEELDRRFEGGFDATLSVVASTGDMAPPHGSFLVGRMGDRSVACGGLKLLDGRTAYLKRMWVDEAVRGTGLGRSLLTALEDEARRLGCAVARLETNRTLVEAIRLYESAGYVRVEAFNDERYAHHWFEKVLEARGDAAGATT